MNEDNLFAYTIISAICAIVSGGLLQARLEKIYKQFGPKLLLISVLILILGIGITFFSHFVTGNRIISATVGPYLMVLGAGIRKTFAYRSFQENNVDRNED